MTRAIIIEIDGKRFDTWQSGEVTRDLKNFAGTFSFTFRDTERSMNTFAFASNIPPIYHLRPGSSVKIYVCSELVLVGYLENVNVDIDDQSSSVAISGKDKAGDLIDCAAAPDGPAEYNNIRLEDAAKRIAGPYGLTVRNEVETGDVFPRYGIDMAETGLSALEKGARQRQVLLLSDGVGGLVITRTGDRRAPADLRLPGNVKSSSGSYTHKNRHSKTIVRGQHEKASGKRKTGPLDETASPLSLSRSGNSSGANLQAGGAPIDPRDREWGTNNATEIERFGTSATGEYCDDEIKRYRPKVHLARTKGNKKDCCCEAEWRSRSARGQSEEISYSVAGFKANNQLWRVNEMVYVSDAFQMVERDMLVSRVSFSEDDSGQVTELTVTSPEAFDNKPVKDRRRNKKGKKKKGGTGPLDETANPL